jgi:hypothetical protein
MGACRILMVLLSANAAGNCAGFPWHLGPWFPKMAIKKQEFYEGAALHRLACTGRITSISYAAPFFLLNQNLSVLLKYSTRPRSPWGFTFTSDEQLLLQDQGRELKLIIALVCGADGVAAFTFDSYLKIASPRKSALHVACYRRHGEHYEVTGPDGKLGGKVSPSDWRRILELGVDGNNESL